MMTMIMYHMMTIKRPDLLKELTLIIYPMIQKLKKTINSNNYKKKKFKNSKIKIIIIMMMMIIMMMIGNNQV